MKGPVQHPPAMPPHARAGEAASRPGTSTSRLLVPREHGAWGLVSLPFVAGAAVAGGWFQWQALAALLAVFAVFLLRAPLLVLWRAAAARRRQGDGSDLSLSAKASEIRTARFSLLLYALAAVAAGGYLLTALPLLPLLVMGAAAALLTLVTLYAAANNRQRSAVLQVVSVAGLTASSLLAYLACRGQLDAPAFWVWGLSAAHGSASVLVVHARLEAMIAMSAARKGGPQPQSHRRNAVLAQACLLALLTILAALGYPWMAAPFVPPVSLHCWELWHLFGGRGPRLSLRRVGYMQLTASVAFCVLLIAVLR